MQLLVVPFDRERDLRDIHAILQLLTTSLIPILLVMRRHLVSQYGEMP
jgi:hypothetical protein